jgi:hypothetical protein
LHVGNSVVELQQAAGHASLAVTTIYANLVGDDQQVVDIFGMRDRAGA